MKKYIGLLVVILAMVSCESLEDTYRTMQVTALSVISVNVQTWLFAPVGTG